MKELKKLLEYLKPYNKWVILAPTLIIFEVIMDLFLPNIMANIVNNGIATNDISYIVLNIILMISLSIIGIAGGIGSVYYASLASESVIYDMRNDLFDKINNLSFFNFNKLKSGNLITVLTNDINIVGNVIMLSLRFLLRVPIVMIGSIFMAIMISPRLSLILLIIIPIMLIVIAVIIKKAFPYFTITQESVDEVNSVVRENLGGIRVVKSFVMEDYEIEKFTEVNKKMMEVMIKAFNYLVLAMPLMMFFINMATLMVLWFGGKLVIANSMEIGNIIAFSQYFTNILTSLLMASMALAFFTRSIASAKRINEIFSLQEDIIEPTSPVNIDGINGKVEFKDVSFSYQFGTGDLVLKNINFTVESGECVAILGATGSGKSTIASMIARFYDPTIGLVLIDDINIKNYAIEDLRKNISVVFQQALLFSDTIKNNIRYSDKNISYKEVVRASKTAHAHQFIMKKKNAYDEFVEQKGTNLSGGQKQRISLARAIASNPSILILDDTTSALDANTEAAVRESLKKELNDKTIFLITQRISTAKDADYIIVLDEGEISGIGTHEELLKNNKVYKDIFASQKQRGVIK